MSSDVVAIIPARGGSKGIPRKNIRMLAGRPLVAHTIECAQRAHIIGRVVVSTDDAEIAGIATDCGAEVVQRPAELSGDAASSESALLHTLAILEAERGYKPEVVVFMQCTSPLTRPEDVDGAVRTLRDSAADSVLAVAAFHDFLWKLGPDGEAMGINHDKQIRLRRQDRATEFVETGAIYALRAAGFMQARHRFFGKTSLYVIPKERSLDIDSLDDLRLAEVLLRERQMLDLNCALPERVGALVLDFDGVLTDNRVLVMETGQEAVWCDRGDGWGVAELVKKGLPVVVISTETNPVVQARCRKLGISCLQGITDKAAAMKDWAGKRGVRLEEVVFLGNDVNDLGCLQVAGCGLVVADAHPQARSAARAVLSSLGGRGAVREICDAISQKRTS